MVDRLWQVVTRGWQQAPEARPSIDWIIEEVRFAFRRTKIPYSLYTLALARISLRRSTLYPNGVAAHCERWCRVDPVFEVFDRMDTRIQALVAPYRNLRRLEGLDHVETLVISMHTVNLLVSSSIDVCVT
jgi:hypothetical protein